MKPKILSDITGKTHGIRFKINPPIKPKNKKVKIPRGGCAACAAATAGASSCQAARSLPLGNFEKTTNPGIADKFLPADSIGIRKTISFDLRDSTLGWPTTVLPCGNGKKSTVG